MALRDLVPWNRAREREVPVRREEHPVFALQDRMNRVFEDFWRGAALPASLLEPEGAGGFYPRVDVEETDDRIVVTAELAGLAEKDFDVELRGDRLILRGEKRRESHDRDGWYERSWGRFERAIPLPREVDGERASARYRNGELRVELPVAESARRRQRRIEVRAS